MFLASLFIILGYSNVWVYTNYSQTSSNTITRPKISIIEVFSGPILNGGCMQY